MHRCGPGLLSLLLATAAALAQSPAAHPVSGTVVNAVTGEPIPKALVNPGAGIVPPVLSDPSGHFTFESFPDGTYGFSVQKPGYLDPSFAQASFSFGPTMITIGPNTPALTLKLIPSASVTGTVLDENGQPIEGVAIHASISEVWEGVRRWSGSLSANTDDSGVYTIEGLTPGEYRLFSDISRVQLQRVANSQTPHSLNVGKVYAGQYFPSGSDPAAAQTIHLAPGATAQADFNLQAVPAFRISGNISPWTPQAFPSLLDAQRNPVSATMLVNPQTGRFAFPNVPAGQWIVTVSSNNQQQLYAEQDISVAGPVAVQLHLEPAANIPVEVSPAMPDGFPGGINLMSDNSRHDRGWNFYTPYQNNSGIANVMPGHYRVNARLNPTQNSQPLCIDSIRSGDTDVLRDGLTVLNGSQPPALRITLRSDCGHLAVTLNQPIATVVAISDNAGSSPPEVFSGINGKLDIPALTPGSYHLYAFNSTFKLEYANPSVLRAYTATDINVDPAQTLSVSLPVIDRDHELAATDAP